MKINKLMVVLFALASPLISGCANLDGAFAAGLRDAGVRVSVGPPTLTTGIRIDNTNGQEIVLIPTREASIRLK